MKLKFLLFFLFFLSVNLSPFPFISHTVSQDEIGFLVISGKNHLKAGNFNLAVQSFEDYLSLVLEINDKELEMECCMNLGLLFWNLDEFEKSLALYSRALLIANKLKLPKAIKVCKSALKISELFHAGKNNLFTKHKESNEYFQEAIKLAKEIESQAHELKCLRFMSMNYFASGSEEFLELNTKALDIAKILNHKIEEMKLFNNIGSYQAKQSNPAYALTNTFEALKIAAELQSKDNIRQYSTNLANIYIKFGDFQKSSEYLSDALTVAREAGVERKTATILITMASFSEKKADIFNNVEDYHKALAYLKEALNLLKEERLNDMKRMVLNNIGNIYIALELYSEAMKYLKLGLDSLKNNSDQSFLEMILTNIGEIQLQRQDYKEAEKLFTQALRIGAKSESSTILRRAHFGLAKIYEEQNKYTPAISHYQEAIKQIERLESNIVLDVNQSGYLYSKLDVFEHLLNLYFTLYKQFPDKDYGVEMFLVAERGKARSFLDNLEESKININKKLSDEYEKKELEITNRISASIEKMSKSDNSSSSAMKLIEKELFQAEDEYTILLNQMLLEKVNISKIISPTSLNLNYIQDRYLSPDTVLIEYSLGEDNSFVFYVSKNIFRIFELPPHAEIKDSIRAYIKILSDPSQDNFFIQKASKRLYLELFSPLDDIIPENVTNLIIIPDGILYYLPFETLLSPSPDKLNGANYLISRYAISYMPSSSSLLFLDNKEMSKPYPKELLIFGAPDYSLHSPSKSDDKKNPMGMLYEIYENQGYQFLPLPYSKEELKGISGYFPNKKTDIYLGKDANENTIKQLPLEDYRVIHFACHSFLDETFPMRSALVLSLDENFKEDGFLKVREIYNFNLNSELVVLSACRTGKGKMEGSDGVLGLPRIFFYAGAKSVISTLWGINDKSSVDFMKNFYQGLRDGKSKTQALQFAKIKMMKSKYSHPYYWAAFILNGDYRSTITSN